jgi:hypothetical protein
MCSRLSIRITVHETWKHVLKHELEDSREEEDMLPIQSIALRTRYHAHFIKFELLSWWGVGGGLQYFNIQRDEEGKITKNWLIM